MYPLYKVYAITIIPTRVPNTKKTRNISSKILAWDRNPPDAWATTPRSTRFGTSVDTIFSTRKQTHLSLTLCYCVENHQFDVRTLNVVLIQDSNNNQRIEYLKTARDLIGRAEQLQRSSRAPREYQQQQRSLTHWTSLSHESGSPSGLDCTKDEVHARIERIGGSTMTHRVGSIEYQYSGRQPKERLVPYLDSNYLVNRNKRSNFDRHTVPTRN